MEGENLPGFKKGDRTDIELPAVQRGVNCNVFTVQVRRLFWLTVQDRLSVWNLRLRSAKLSCRHGIPVSKVVRLLPRYYSVIIIQRGNYRLLSIAMCLSCLTLKIITWPEEMNIVRMAPFRFGYGVVVIMPPLYGKTVLDKNELTAGQSLKLTVPVTNTVKRNGRRSGAGLSCRNKQAD